LFHLTSIICPPPTSTSAAADCMGHVNTIHELRLNGNHQLSDQPFTNSLSQLYYHLKIRNANTCVKIILKTKHHNHVIFTNKFQFLKPDGSTIQSKTNAF